MKLTPREHLSWISYLTACVCLVYQYSNIAIMFLVFALFWQLRESGSLSLLLKDYKNGLESLRK